MVLDVVVALGAEGLGVEALGAEEVVVVIVEDSVAVEEVAFKGEDRVIAALGPIVVASVVVEEGSMAVLDQIEVQ